MFFFPSVGPERKEQERKDLLFSTLKFWEELRAAIAARQHARFARAPRPSSASYGPRFGAPARNFFAAPTAAELIEEQRRVDRARQALPKLIKEAQIMKSSIYSDFDPKSTGAVPPCFPPAFFFEFFFNFSDPTW